MTTPDWLWIPITLAASGAQTARNAAQRQLTGTLGGVGATLVRFLYGLPITALAALTAIAVGGAPSQPWGCLLYTSRCV